MLLSTIGIFIAIYAFAILTETPKKYLLHAAIVGTISGFIYLFSIKLGGTPVLSSFFSALGAALISHIFARIFRGPVTLFLIAGILPTVPGGGMYRIAAGALDGNSGMVFHSFIETLEIAGAIALAIFLMDALFRVKRISKKKEP